MACVAVASLLRTLELEFLQYQPRPVIQDNGLITSCNKELIQSLHEKLGDLIKQLDEKRMDGIEAIKHLETKLRDLAFRVEDEIEFQIAHLYDRPDVDEDEVGIIADLFVEEEEEAELRVAADLYVEKPQRATTDAERTSVILQWAVEEIDSIKEELVKIKNREELEGRKTTALDVLLRRSEVVDSSQRASHSQGEMVGKNDEFEIIKKLLTELGSKQRKVVSIIGMGGIGKTTLATRLYKDLSIAIHFDVRAWVIASQLHNKRQMLIGLLNSISELGNNVESSTYEDLALRLYQCLKRQRYMIVIDDVWSKEAWDDVSKCFPDDENGSRVLLTTRLTKVANYTSPDNDFSHQMQFLDQSDSWNLFCEKACKSRSAEFEIIGRSIVEKCKGLPIAIIVGAGLFSKLNTLNEWESITKALDSSATTIAATCSKILSLSYNHLPYDLKACFLYLGVFPEDHEIKANELTRLWSAEGLIQASESENYPYEVVAKRHIEELMDRNLILVTKQSHCGRKIKTFRVHDLLLAFCVTEAQNENLLHIVRENGSSFVEKCFRWVSIQSLHFDVSTLLYNSSRGCRSIVSFSRYISLNLKRFKLLRVLFSNDTQTLNNIEDLVHLRYLSRALIINYCNILKVSRAWNLQALQTRANGERNHLEFPKLQYYRCSNFSGHPLNFVHQNLQSIYWLEPSHCTKEFFTHIPYVKKIRIKGEKRKDVNDCIENLVYLQQLERLYINAYEKHCTSPPMIQINNHIVLLKNLKRLELEDNCFKWNGINVLCKLPKLEILKLWGDACVGREWELPENEKFCQLIYLEIGPTNIQDWKATSYHFPKLEYLVLCLCEKLKEIPNGFAEISTLKSIKLMGCLPSVVTSAKEIKEEQLDYLNNIVDVVVAFQLN